MVGGVEMKKMIFIIEACLLVAGCTLKTPEGLKKTDFTGGPTVIFDLEAHPLPEIPFPNDIATISDPDTPTGLRLNVTEEAPTALERDVRHKINRIDGFSIYGPITVSFDRRLDINNILLRHAQEIPDFSDDAVYLFNIDPDSPGFGEAVLLDLGLGHFPLVLEKNDNYFPNDPRSEASNLLLETYDEDVNGNGVLDKGEDTDFDGVLDYPNVYPPGGDPYKDLLDFYEYETNTLIIRPVVPLREETRYAVVLTKRLIGENGLPVQSPFAYINHLQQTEELKPLLKVLSMYGISLDDVAFTWAFTTQSTTRTLREIRRGLYGKGPLEWLSRKYPPELHYVQKLTATGDNLYILKVDANLKAFLSKVAELLAGSMPEEQIKKFIALFDFIDYFLGFTFKTPYFLADRDGIAQDGYPADDDEIFDIDLKRGKAFVGEDVVTVFCAIPKATAEHKPPFPVDFYGHGYTSFRLEMLGFAGSLAKFGIATCSMDAVGHGADLDPFTRQVATTLAEAFGLQDLFVALTEGRSRDLNNDGVSESGGDFWTADTFHTRDVVRQTIVDYMQLIRIMRSWDGIRKWRFDLNGDGDNEIAGDFNGDGVVDMGGPDTDYYAWGQSLGGILSAILAGIEPAVVAAAPVAGGAGLSDIGIRSVQGGVVEAVFLKIMGPIIIGRPDGDQTLLEFYVPDVNRKGVLPFYRTDAIKPGDRVVVQNLINGEEDYAIVSGDGNFRLQIPADAVNPVERRPILGLNNPPGEAPTPVPAPDNRALGDALRILVYWGDSDEVKLTIDTFGLPVTFAGTLYPKGSPLVSPAAGFGIKRNTPDMRRFMSIAQMILDPGDPVAYAPHYFLDPIDFSDVTPGLQAHTNVLVVATVGDMNVPVNTGVAIARAAGIIDYLNPHPCYGVPPDRLYVDFYVLEGVEKLGRFIDRYHGVPVLFDIDDLDNTHDFYDYDKGKTFYVPDLNDYYPECGPLRSTVERPDGGVSALRMPYMVEDGQHGFFIPSPQKSSAGGFDMDNFMINQIGRYFQTGGRELVDDPCLENDTCSFTPPVTY